MGRRLFLFDLDSVVVKNMIFEEIAQNFGININDEEDVFEGKIPYKQKFIQRVELIKDIPIIDIQELICNMELNKNIVEFLSVHKERCYIVTEYLDVWLEKLITKLQIEKNVICSRALIDKGKVQDVLSVVDKYSVANQMVLPFVAVGSKDNDVEMINAAEIGIGYWENIQSIDMAVLECATHAIFNEDRLVSFLNKLV